MNYDLIAQKVEELTTEKTIHAEVKKGRRVLNGITIGSGKVRPTFYVEYFTGLENEDEIAYGIASAYKETEKEVSFELPNFEDFCSLKNMIIPCLVNKGAFIDKEIVLKNFLSDIDICYRIILNDFASVIIRSSFLEMWNVNFDDIHEVAVQNVLKEEIYFNDLIHTVIENECCDEYTKNVMIEKMSGQMFILSNKKRNNGSNIMLNKEMLATIQERIGDFLIIPSSIHELILVPYDESVDISYVSKMVREVNSNEVNEDEILSYSVFCYKAESGLKVA